MRDDDAVAPPIKVRRMRRLKFDGTRRDRATQIAVARRRQRRQKAGRP
jgi:hypothetical protein